MLEPQGVDYVFSTGYNRTMETASPSADFFATDLLIYDSSEELINSLVTRPRFSGKTILIVGHSNTVPKLIARAGGPEGLSIDHSEYDNLFFLHRSGDENIRFLHLKYGPDLSGQQDPP